jgi:23S rRNA pseudouridine2605 synthase
MTYNSSESDAVSQSDVERLHKFLSRAGIASRRKSEELIAAGRVKVNGVVVSVPGSKVDPQRDRVEVDGQLVVLSREHVYLLVNKPVGYVSTVHDPQGRHTVIELVPQGRRLYPVGRLDRDSEGLLLLTDDGELTQRLTHPSFEHEKEYQVLVAGRPSEAVLQRLRDGVKLEDGVTCAADVVALRAEASGTWLRFVIHEGRKRQLRRMCDAVTYPAQRLIRVRMGPLTLGDLAVGQHRSLTPAERTRLRQAVGLD